MPEMKHCVFHGWHSYWLDDGRCEYCANGQKSRMVEPKRPSWDHYYLTLAYTVAKRATCPRASVGAVLVRDNRLLVCGYNGSVKSAPHCLDVGCLMKNDSCQRAVHAECNAVIQAALHGVSTAGATLYCTHMPCLNCTKMLINAGITRIVYGEAYRVSDDAMAMLEQAKIGVTRYE